MKVTSCCSGRARLQDRSAEAKRKGLSSKLVGTMQAKEPPAKSKLDGCMARAAGKAEDRPSNPARDFSKGVE